jgi:hypothetical protein
MNELTLDGNVITIRRPFDRQVQLEIIKEDSTESILEGITEPITMDTESMSEIFWLTKVLGDYSINKIGDNFVFNNGSQAMLLKRI